MKQPLLLLLLALLSFTRHDVYRGLLCSDKRLRWVATRACCLRWCQRVVLSASDVEYHILPWNPPEIACTIDYQAKVGDMLDWPAAEHSGSVYLLPGRKLGRASTAVKIHVIGFFCSSTVTAVMLKYTPLTAAMLEYTPSRVTYHFPSDKSSFTAGNNTPHGGIRREAKRWLEFASWKGFAVLQNNFKNTCRWY